VGFRLSAQAGETRIRQVVTSAGFSRFPRVAATPSNIRLVPIRKKQDMKVAHLSLGDSAVILFLWAGQLSPGSNTENARLRKNNQLEVNPPSPDWAEEKTHELEKI
jgi:hypothetical protein